MILGRDDWRAHKIQLLLICGFAVCCYLPALFATFFADDNIYLAFSNRALRDTRWTELDVFFRGVMNPWEFLPIRDISYWLDFQFYEVDGLGFHLSNLLWYGLSSFAAWWFFRELLLLCKTVAPRDVSTLALLGTAIFVSHPAHVEAVAWVASRKDLIGGALSLGGGAFAAMRLRLVDGRLEGWFLVGLLLLIATFGKASAVTGVLMIAAVCVARPEVWGSLVPRKLRMSNWLGLAWVWSVAVLAVYIHYKTAGSLGVRLENQISTLELLERGSRIFAKLIEILVFPYPLGFYHDVYDLSSWHWGVSVVGVLFLLVAMASLFSRPRLWAFGIVQIVTSILLYLQFVPFSTWSLASERFVFVAVAGVSMIIMDVVAVFMKPSRACYLVTGIVVGYSVIVLSRLDEWRQVDRLIIAEQANSPEFHNTKRDRIVYQLLPHSKYDEAKVLASTIDKPYAQELLMAYIDFVAVLKAETAGIDAAEARRKVCEKRMAVEQKFYVASAAIIKERDLSVNNIIRGVAREMPAKGQFSSRACLRS